MLGRLKQISAWLDDSVTGDTLGALALIVMLIAGLFVGWGIVE